ncbi:ras guanine nucleotide exchange factor domain-containing protein [Emericellopsis atlantica]|uniref:Ras guanine nucleotide exchange factor domain-containing protein n=1 Tax=Emericellopsis atlantica TaxID=2614577 RepID=A0A9P7ZT46_9HYPO|nr:ras guanine nucleotide exchange factor domain-containing protein [Emericellopsis atlantica]KAG9257621.1 ras guanine nucleotide exchange factor domain-containing protein [Emericellopsis atlantica]
MTPPQTPSSSQEDLSEDQGPPTFHNFLRAHYPFDNSALDDSNITMPLDRGDILMVHSIHTTGWADGTLLATGSRGWVPTNYCESYEPEEIRSLLHALLNFWDLLRSPSINDRELFSSQEYLRGMIAGIRHLLQRTNCLHKESSTVQRSDLLRRCRKDITSETSSLVRAARKMQELQDGTLNPPQDPNDICDEMVLKACQIVLKGVQLIDTLEEERRNRAPASVRVMDTVTEESVASSFDLSQAFPLPLNRRLSSFSRPPTRNESSPQGHRVSSSLSHRVSLAGPSSYTRPQFLVSERLSRSHDAFLSHIGSFIGRLSLQSQSCPELASAIKQCASSGSELLAVVDAVGTHSHSNCAALALARSILCERIHELVYAARDSLVQAASEEDLIMPNGNKELLMSATGCVRSAGDCIAKVRNAIERLGDFELVELDSSGLDMDLSILDAAARMRERKQSHAGLSETASAAESSGTAGSRTPGPRHAHTPSLDKPLPEIPAMELSQEANPSPPPSRPESQHSQGTSRLNLLPKLSTTLPSAATENPHDHEYHHSSRVDSMIASSAGSSATYLSRDSETSIVSQASTRATTPDHTLVPRPKPSVSELSATASSTLTEEVEEVESRLMEKTYVHELMFNKEGHVTGGSLPALVERLTTHEAAPDTVFLSTFYLTFRLFCTPTKLAEALIDRFDYVGDSPRMSGPVRLRVYNFFKGWLETHWRDETDREALVLILPFAEGRLSHVLPAATGRRLVELAKRVSSGTCLVPRLVSSMGKTNTAIAQHIASDTPLPPPIMSRSQQNALNAFKAGGNTPSILDFDPLELARQLTVKQMSIFSSIMPEELLAQKWMKNGGVETPHVKAMSSLTTGISNWVACTILHNEEIKKRAAVIKQWIKTANHCYELHNYDCLLAIMCTIQSTTISRLRKTWDLISTKRKDTLTPLQEVSDTSFNYKALRARLHDHVSPCLPFLGMYLTDLSFVEVGNPATRQMAHGSETGDQRASGLTVVNFDKHSLTAKIIGELQRFQIPYRLAEHADMQEWLTVQIDGVRESDKVNVQRENYRKSLALEPRETVPRTPLEQTPMPTPTTSRGDFFGWMTRERSQTNTPAPL